LFILIIHAFCLTLAIGEVTLEAPQNALLGALQTQEKATFVQQQGTKEDSNTALAVAPQSGCGHTNELHAAQKPVLRPSGFDREKSTVGTIGFQNVHRVKCIMELFNLFILCVIYIYEIVVRYINSLFVIYVLQMGTYYT
jgi:hypothetical protein